ncbi:MAG: M14 family zinc carboxypeptidase [Gemmatimonadales bacterium]
MRTAILLFFAVVGFVGVPPAVSAQQPPADLTTLFDLGRLVLDTNRDSVPDLLNASFVLGPTPSVAETAAATEIAGRLGFETMALDLPLARGATGSALAIVIGRSGLAASGLSDPDVDPTSLDSGEGVVATQTANERTWVLVLGGDDAGLLAGARLLAGVLPHTRTLSAPRLDSVRVDLATALDSAGVAGAEIRLTQARARSGSEGIALLVADVTASDVAGAEAAMRTLADTAGAALPPDSTTPPRRTPLAYAGLAEVEVRLAGGTAIRLPGRAEPERPGPVAARPGNGAKAGLDLSNLYTAAGLLGGEPIPSRVDAMLVPGDSAIDRLPELGARLGLEAAGLAVPLTEPSSTLERPATQPTLVLAGTHNALTDQLADSGKVALAAIAPNEGLIELVPKAFGDKSALVVTGADSAGAVRALEQVAITLPHIAERGEDRPTLDDVEQELWDALAGYSPVGQAAIALYKLDRIGLALADRALASADVLVSIEEADSALAAYVRGRAATALRIPAADVHVAIDDRDVQRATTIFEETREFPSEIDRFWSLIREQVLPVAGTGEAIRVEARLSEPPELRAQLAGEARRMLIAAGADPSRTEVEVLSAFKQGYSWLYERVRPRIVGQPIGDIVIRFRRNEPPAEWPQQAIQSPVRWLHEIFPIDEIFAHELGVPIDRIRFEETSDGPTYEVHVTDRTGREILFDTFEPKWLVRPFFDRFADYEHVRVTTGWLTATSGDLTLVDERISTDPETFWDYFQGDVLPAMYDYVMERHEGLPRGGSIDAPFFGELVVELDMSEPDYRLGLDNEAHSTMDALHEEIYFGTLEFFDVLGRNSRGQALTFPGRVIPRLRPRGDGGPIHAHVRLSGFATSRPAVVVRYADQSGDSGEIRLDVPKTTLARPSARRARVRVGEPGISELALRVRVDTERDVRDSLLVYAPPETVDRTMVSAEQVVSTLSEIEALRAAGMYRSALAFGGLGRIEVWAEWAHEQSTETRRIGTLAANGSPAPLPDWRSLVPRGWSYDGERLVQWETPIPPPEGNQILAKMAQAFPEATMYRAGRTYLGRDVWAMDLMSPVSATHWSHVKASTFKPTIVYSAREHANEVSSTSHVLRNAELLLTDSLQRRKLDRVNVVVHPFTNADGAQLAYDLFQVTPDFILHAGYLAALGANVTIGQTDDHPIHPEARVRQRLWETWLPDVFLNPHGYPSRQLVQLFSEFSGLVRAGRVTERNWGMNKGWFMPGFDYVDSPDFPRHRDAAFDLRGYITRALNADSAVVAMNRRAYARYERYGARWDPDVFRLPLTDSVMIEMPLKGSTGEPDGGFDPRVTIFEGIAESPDETAHGAWLELVATAGLNWDQAVLDYLVEGDHEVKRSGSTFFGGVTLRMERPRPPETEEEPTEGN